MTSPHPLRCAFARASLRALPGALLAVGLLTAPAWSASVVELRVGRHPTFTRVVFELDSPSGYGVERQEGSGGATTLVVTLEARSAPRQVASKSPLLESVSIESPRGGKAVARIRLRQGGLRHTEMILANPPRIVVDVLSPEAAPLSARLGNQDPEPAPAQTPKAEPPKAAPVAEAAPPPEPVAAKPEPPAAKPIARAAAPVPSAEPRAGAAAPPELPVVPPASEPAPETASGAPPAPGATALAENPAAGAPVAVAPTPPEAPSPAAKASGSTRPAPPETKPAAPVIGRKTQPSGPFGLPFDATLLAAAAAAVLGVVLVTLLALRRRRRSDAEGLAADDGSDAGASPFDSFGASETREDEFGGLETGSAGAGSSSSRMERGPFAESATSLFDDDDDEKGDEPMQRTETQMGGATAMDAGLPMTRGSVRADSDLARVVSELERRLAQAEARLDETVETCERLERQVAAQSEELRVQRAAIARTQRALRSLSRSEEEQATEPALREPR